MLKVLHFSDSHLSFRQFQMNQRLEDFARALDEVHRIAVQQQVDLVVDTGDTFNSPDPDPWSVRAYRLFVEKVVASGIKILGIVGNHNKHEGEAWVEGRNTWLDAVSDEIIRPNGPEGVIRIFSRDGSDHIDVVAADWMMADTIDDFVSRIPEDVDALFMHQSCEGFMPVIARPEMRLSQIDGKARYVGVGDIHVTRKQETPKGTIVGSAGPTEMSRSDEPSTKYVVLVTFNAGGDRTAAPLWEPIAINTRRVITHPCMRSRENIESLRGVIMNAITSGVQSPMIISSFSRSLSGEISAFKNSLRDMGVDMLRLTPEPDVSEAVEVREETSRDQSVLMPDILSELIKSDEARSLALALWSNPSSATSTIESFRARMVEKFISEEKQ